MRVRPAGREACNCASPYNSILERLDAMQAEILTAMQEANTAVGIANAALRQVQAAGIRTVNQIQPDADGEFSITAGTGIQINAGTNGIEIENTSQGAVYTGVSPIEVNADNEISLKDWVLYEDNDWSIFVSNYELTEDIAISWSVNLSNFYSQSGYTIIPKGTSIFAATISKELYTVQNSSLTNTSRIGAFVIDLTTLFTNQSTVSGYAEIISMYQSGSGINEVFKISTVTSTNNIMIKNSTLRPYINLYRRA